jgi:hypothetical protein
MMKPVDTLLRCDVCGSEQTVNFANCLEHGWMACCGGGMLIVSTSADIHSALRSTVQPLGNGYYQAKFYLPLSDAMLQGILKGVGALPFCPMKLNCSDMTDEPMHCPNFETCFYNMREDQSVVDLER